MLRRSVHNCLSSRLPSTTYTIASSCETTSKLLSACIASHRLALSSNQHRHSTAGFVDSSLPTQEAKDNVADELSSKRQQHLSSKSAARLRKVDLRALTKSNTENQYIQTDILEEGLTASIYRQVVDYRERRQKEEHSLQEAARLNKLDKQKKKAAAEAASTNGSGPEDTAATTTAASSDLSDDINETGKATPKQIRQLFHDSVKARTVANTSLRRYLRSLPQGEGVLAKAAVEGAESAGLVLDSDTLEQYLELLMSSGFLREGLQLYQQMIRNKNPPNTRAYNCLMRLCVLKHATESALKLFDEMGSKGRQQDKESYEIALNAIASQQPVDWVRAVQIFEKATGGTQQALRRANLLQEEEEAESMREGTAYTGNPTSTPNSRSSSTSTISTSSGGGSTMMRAITGKGWKKPQEKGDRGDLEGLPESSGFVSGRHHSGTNVISASTYNALMRVYLNMQPFEWRVVYNCYYEMRNNKPKIRISWESYELVAEAMRRGEAGRFRRLLTYLDAWFQLTNLGSWRFIAGLFVYGCIGLVIKFIMGFFVQRNLINNDKTIIPR